MSNFFPVDNSVEVSGRMRHTVGMSYPWSNDYTRAALYARVSQLIPSLSLEEFLAGVSTDTNLMLVAAAGHKLSTALAASVLFQGRACENHIGESGAQCVRDIAPYIPSLAEIVGLPCIQISSKPTEADLASHKAALNWLVEEGVALRKFCEYQESRV